MLTSLHIKNFRGFRDLKIEPLKRINLLTGQNNTGKTGVLEALALVLDDPAPSINLRNNLPTLFRIGRSQRNGDFGNPGNDSFWKWLFHNKSLTKNIEIQVVLDGQKEQGFYMVPHRQSPIDQESSRLHELGQLGIFHCYMFGNYQGAGHKPAVFSTHPSDPVQEAIDYNRVILKRRKKQVEMLLREIEPRLDTVEALQTEQPGQSSFPLIYADVGLKEMIPVTNLGQGFNRLLDIYSEIVAADAKVLLIDEIENGMHHSVLPVIWKGLFRAAEEFGVQIFATTHSWECILAADEAARAQKNYDLALIRLDRVKDDIKATVIDEKSLTTAKELHWEMR